MEKDEYLKAMYAFIAVSFMAPTEWKQLGAILLAGIMLIGYLFK